MTKKERVVAKILGNAADKIPTGFSMHFPENLKHGDPAVKAHLDFFHETDTDILKIMNENLVPNMGQIKNPEDWKCIKSFDLTAPFMQEQIELTENILDNCEQNAFTMGTLHGITASAIHPIEAVYGYDAVRQLLADHLRENKAPVFDAMKRIAQGMCCLARKYIELGLDAVYYASLGGENCYFTDEEFAEFIEPLDKLILSEIKKAGGYSFLHICKDGLNMQRYKNYVDCTDVVNWGVYEVPFTIEQGKKLFPGKTIMGGLANRSGVLVDGTDEELEKSVREIIAEYGSEKFILGADCTIPTELPYNRIKKITEIVRAI